MIFKNLMAFLLFQSLLLSSSYAAQCNFNYKNIYKENTELVHFLKNSLFATHLQLTHENFNSMTAHQSRAKIFDMLVDIEYWNQKFSKPSEFKFFWNWIRFQYWGLLQQQALLREDQGFKISLDKSLTENFPSILKFPIYPQPISVRSYVCSEYEQPIYPCNKDIIKVDVLLSPALACDKSMDINSLKFSYFLTKEINGWVSLDIQFKGRSLIADSFAEYDNMVNKYGPEKALSFLKILVNKVPMIDLPTPSQSGSFVFDREVKIKAPPYPIKY